MEPSFLTFADVIRIHVDQIERYGGQVGGERTTISLAAQKRSGEI